MTQFSFNWGCGSTGDQGNITVDKMMWFNMLIGNANPAEDGVVYWRQTTVPPFTGFTNAANGLLAPSNPSGSTVRIDSGVGLVQGWLYLNDDNVDFDISSDLGNASATDLIVLERSVTNQTVRLARVKGSAGTTATVTQTSTTWQIPIAEVALTAGGDFSSLTDVRTLAHPPVGSWVKIEAKVVDSATGELVFSSIPPLFNALVLQGVVKSTYTGATTDFFNLEINGDTTTANYTSPSMGIASNSSTSQSDYDGAGVSGSALVSGFAQFLDGFVPYVEISSTEASVPTAESSMVDIMIFGARSEDFYKQFRYHSYAAYEQIVRINHGQWESTSQITSIELPMGNGNFAVGSRITLYGII